MQLELRPCLLDLWPYGRGQLGAMVCEEADDGAGDLELEQHRVKDSDGDTYTATHGFMDIPNVRRVERLARHTVLTKVKAGEGGDGVGIDWSPRRP
jgi:hypothetical protein